MYSLDLEKYDLTPQKYEEVWSAIEKKVSGETPDVEWQDIIDDYNLPLTRESLRKMCTSKPFGGVSVLHYFKNKDIPEKSETSINKDGSITSDKLVELSETDSKDATALLKAHGFDPRKWEIISARNSIWKSGIKNLYSSRISVKPSTTLNFVQIEDFYKELSNKYYSPIVRRQASSNDGLLLEIPIMDVHFGKLSHSEDVADPYNFKLAKERFDKVIDDVIFEVNDMDISTIVLPVGSDFFHVDTVGCTTTAGTLQDNDLSPQLIFKYGLDCLIENIIKLSQIAPVEVFCVNGNHDFLTSYHAVCALNCYFKNNENVNVSTETSPRKYFEFGNVLIGFAHGDKEKKRIETLMQVEAREAWGRTKYHEIHLGHLHSEHVQEVGGVIIRNLPSITGDDLWTHNSGYVGAQKRNMSFLWNKETGLKRIIISEA